MADTLTVSRWTTGMHELAELEIEAAYYHGYEAGRAAERADIEAAAAGIARSPFPPYLSPSAEQVVADLVTRIRAESRPTTAPPAGNHPGGPVPTWEADR